LSFGIAMKRNQAKAFVFLLGCKLLFLFSSCHKTEWESPLWESYELMPSLQIQNLQYFIEEDRFYGVGGKGWEYAALFSFDVREQKWETHTIAPGKSLFCFYLREDGWIAGGLEGSIVWVTKEGVLLQEKQLPLREIRGIYPNASGWEVVGFDNFTQGKSFLLDSLFSIVEDTLLSNSLRALAYHPEEEAFFAGGYGLAVHWTQNKRELSIISNFAGDQIEAIVIDGKGTVHMIGYAGEIFSKNRLSLHWQRRSKRRDFGLRNPGFRTATLVPKLDYLVVAGERGNVFVSKDGGFNWNKIPSPKVDFLSSASSDSLLILGSREGLIYTYPTEFL